MTISTKEKIFYISLDLFSQKGFSGVSIREITREVGIKESSLYNHFSSKDEILESILNFFREDFSKTLPPLETLNEILQKHSVESFLRAGLHNFKKYMEDETGQKMWRLLQVEQFRSPLAREIILHDLYGKTIEFLEIVFTKFIEFKKIRPYNPKVLAIEYQNPVFSLLTEYNILKFDGKGTAEVEKKLEQHIDFFLNTILEK
ncbi:TetR/AcrR family transcriptional regulator [Caldibacillus sp. 210928-DFI.2.22]|uniref:TetR/AcrR family transcriptional regulator n=1 Tax=unclassified Caldibacillus TaxID=2641266 RepID=UPI001D079C63|nr:MULTISPECIES: TetR/AcrR family transcriptional regulator [unclassified Caldibacillus]MCB7069648.1 TetR/AcrR family transcriptional regulator [Caldibacillus sp. 210928-DFI.2.22]MCB7073027.1 TetR/AcrR family transcriptional regulator [Caldibacillus sp. 210928-DFI.2.18]